MTQAQLDEILAGTDIEKKITALSISSFNIPKWSDLEPQYDPLQHAIITDTARYPIILNEETSKDDFPRIPRGLQSLSVDRLTQAQFVTPVERVYSYDVNSKTQKQAVDVIEELYRIQNNIDAENLERGKQVNASCEVATIWRVYNSPNRIGELETSFKLAHTSYSPMEGYSIYANIDNNKNIIVISFEYKDSSDVEFFDVYVGGLKPQFISYTKGKNGWVLTKLPSNPKILDFFPVVYNYLKKPVWGGLTGTAQVEVIEETWSYRAYYIRKNAAPIFVMDKGDTSGMKKSDAKESDKDSKKIIPVGRQGSITALVWASIRDITSDQIKDMETAFFDDNQIANIAMSVLLKANATAENKELTLTDSKAKAIDLGGEWQKLFNDELNNIVIPFAKVMFPDLADDFDMISVRSIVKPYSVKTDKENSEFVSTAGTSMSLPTRVRTLNKVTDIDAEVTAIEEERGAEANQM